MVSKQESADLIENLEWIGLQSFEADIGYDESKQILSQILYTYHI